MSAQTSAPAARPWPTEVRLRKDRRHLTVTWDDGRSHTFSAEFLRVHSPSAEVQGHGPGQNITVAGKAEVEILSVEPVGHYAVRLNFDDLHTTGIYGWDLLRRFAETEAALWQDYLAELAAKNLTREPRRSPR